MDVRILFSNCFYIVCCIFRRIMLSKMVILIRIKPIILLFDHINCVILLVPRSMIPDAVFHEFPGWNPQENARNWTQESSDRIWLPILPGSCVFRAKPNKSDHRNTASTFRRFPLFSCGIWPILLDLGSSSHSQFIHLIQVKEKGVKIRLKQIFVK
jgi:hypothetical protein